jgi:hypothetical protein
MILPFGQLCEPDSQRWTVVRSGYHPGFLEACEIQEWHWQHPPG